MPCDTYRMTPEQTEAQRRREVDAALAALEASMRSGRVEVRIDRMTGALTFAGWREGTDRKVTDACAYRTLAARGSWELRQAVARAEALAGRSVSEQAIASGVHSHDGGATWGRD